MTGSIRETNTCSFRVAKRTAATFRVRDISEVMLATSLVPEGALVLAPG
ncbi:MAG: hypothetical protein HY319_17760 [Armatimonadetes bacterium]|nr:hypothetical protein [Armatimonadota bacterium]